MADSSTQTTETERPEKKRKLNGPAFREPTSTVILTAGYGNNIQQYIVHEEVACFYSPVLTSVFAKNQSSFNLGQEPSVVRRFVQWLYSQELILHMLHNEVCDDYCLEYAIKQIDDLIHLWILADFLTIPALQDLVIKSLDEIYHRGGQPFFESIVVGYKYTNPGSTIGRYLVALCVHNSPYSAMFGQGYEFPQEFLQDMIHRLSMSLQESQKSYRLSDYFCNEEL